MGHRLFNVNVSRYLLCFSVLFILGLNVSRSQGPKSTTTVILVRHAEKDTMKTDPPLNAAGKERARELVYILSDAGVEAIFTTQYLRTQQTVQPLAEKFRLKPRIVEADPKDVKGHAKKVANEVLAEHRGEVVLVSSHSNVIPLIIEALGVAKAPEIPDGQYDDLFIVAKTLLGDATLLRLKFGRPTP